MRSHHLGSLAMPRELVKIWLWTVLSVKWVLWGVNEILRWGVKSSHKKRYKQGLLKIRVPPALLRAGAASRKTD